MGIVHVRRKAVCVLAVVGLLGGLLATAAPAGAQRVANPSGGTFKLKVSEATLTIGDNTFDFSDSRLPQCSDGVNNDVDLLGGAPQDNAVDFPADPQCTSALDDSEVQGGFQPLVPVTLTGTIVANGDWNVPTSGVVFPQVWLFARPPVLGATVVTVTTSATHAATGNLNPLTGASSLRVRIKVDLDGNGLGADCAIGTTSNPIDINQFITGTTNPPGPNTPITGVPYNADTGTLRLVNNSFAVPGASGCSTFPINVNQEINNSLGLPSPAGRNTAIFDGIFDPVSNRPLRAITAVLGVTPDVACRPVGFSAAGSTAVRPVASYSFDYTDDGTFDQVGVSQTATTTFPAPGTHTARLRVTDVDGDFHETTQSYTVGANLPATATFSPDPVPRVPHGGSQAVTLGGSDPEAGALSFSIVSGPSHGTLSGSAPGLTYTAGPGYAGPDSFTFRVSDDCGNTTDRTVALTVNALPLAADQSVTTNQNIAVPVTLTGSDPDGDVLSFAVLTLPTNGTLSGTAPNLTYTPDVGFSGSDSFTFAVDDGYGGSDTGTVDVTVRNLSRPVRQLLMRI